MGRKKQGFRELLPSPYPCARLFGGERKGGRENWREAMARMHFSEQKAKLTMSAGFPPPKCHLGVQRAQSGQLQPGSGAHRSRQLGKTPLPPPKIKIKINNYNNNNDKKDRPASFLAGIVPGRTAQNKQLQSKGFI